MRGKDGLLTLSGTGRSGDGNSFRDKGSFTSGAVVRRGPSPRSPHCWFSRSIS